jgi:hypothetical protein
VAEERERQEKPADSVFYRPDESQRRELAKRWLAQARGESEEPEASRG